MSNEKSSGVLRNVLFQRIIEVENSKSFSRLTVPNRRTMTRRSGPSLKYPHLFVPNELPHAFLRLPYPPQETPRGKRVQTTTLSIGMHKPLWSSVPWVCWCCLNRVRQQSLHTALRQLVDDLNQAIHQKMAFIDTSGSPVPGVRSRCDVRGFVKHPECETL